MRIVQGQPLAGLTTFRIGGDARFFCVAESIDDVRQAVSFAQEKNLPTLILGGGSNVLVSDGGFDGLVVQMQVKGIQELENVGVNALREGRGFGSEEGGADQGIEAASAAEGARTSGFQRKSACGRDPWARSRVPEGTTVSIKAGAGENWDDFVAWTVARGYGGLENLSLIPGTVGAAPVQNIGAYGAEVASFIQEVEALDRTDATVKTLSNAECAFSYRDSLFKRELGRYVILSVTFILEKGRPADISYKDLKEYFAQKNLRAKQFEKAPSPEPVSPSADGAPTSRPQRPPRVSDEGLSLPASEPPIAEVREAVIAIRTAKLPDVRKVGTAGSFFKNPIIEKAAFDLLKKEYPELPGFPEHGGRVKVPAAWIIDKVCGLKGKRFGRAGIHDTQALVIVNCGDATFAEVDLVAREVEKAVKEKTGVELEREVVMV